MRALAWIIRVPLYLAAAWLSLFVLAPLFPGSAGILITAPIAAAIVCLDLWMTAKLRGRSVQAEVSSRILVADRVLSPRGQSLADSYSTRPELEVDELGELERGWDRGSS